MENIPSAASLSLKPNLRLLACSRVGIHDVDILRFWLLNVIPQVDAVAVLIVSEEKDDYAPIEELCRAFGVKYRRHDITYFRDDQTIRSLEDWLREMPADWVIHTDCDELIAGDLREIAQRLEAEGVDYAEGTMIDRLPADGKLRSLAGLETVADLERAFPLRLPLTRILAASCDRKVPFCRWPHIGFIHDPGPFLKRKSTHRFALAHYKWREGLVERLKKRISNLNAANLPWGPESELILEELEIYGRIRPERWTLRKKASEWLRHVEVGSSSVPIYRIWPGSVRSQAAFESWHGFPVIDIPAVCVESPDLFARERACSQAHANVLRAFLATPAEHCAVIEDDVVLHHSAWLHYADFDYFQPFACNRDDTPGDDFTIRHGILTRYGTLAQIVSRRFAEAYIPLLEKGGIADLVNGIAAIGMKAASYASNAVTHDFSAASMISEERRLGHIRRNAKQARRLDRKLPYPKVKFVLEESKGVSFCTLCKGRRYHLEQTLRRNLASLQLYDAEIVLVDYRSNDGLSEWIAADFQEAIQQRRLRFCELQEDLPLSLPIGKNFAHRLASKDIVVNIDADNFIGELFPVAQPLREREILVCGEIGKGSFGRIGLTRGVLEALNGYDESFDPAGYYDADLIARAVGLGLRRVTYPCRIAALQHTKEETVTFMGGGGYHAWKKMQSRNAHRSHANLQENRFRANGAGLTIGHFRINFQNIVKLGANEYFFRETAAGVPRRTSVS